jgi:hypothetical protein
MTLQGADSSKRYEVILETAGVRWQAIWRTVDPEGTPVRGPHGSTVDANGVELLERVKAMLTGEDPSVAGLDWSYEKPLPPWKDEQPG